MRKYISFLSIILLAIIPIGFLLLMVVAPVVAMGRYGDEALVWGILSDDYMRWRVLWTLIQALVTCALVLLLGTPIAWVLARFDFAGRKLVLRLLMLPFVMPTLVAGIGVLALFGARGLLWSGWQDTPYLLLYGNVFFNLPVLIRAAYQGLVSVPASRLWAAQSLGANGWYRFWQVEWPVLLPWLAGGLCLVFLYCFSGFGLALLLGGTRYATVEVEIYQLIAYELDMAQATVLVWLVLGMTLLAALAYAWLSQKAARATAIAPLPAQITQGWRQKSVLVGALLLLLLCCVLPLAAIVWRAAHAGASWQVLLDAHTHQAVYNTLRFTAMAMLLALVLGISHAALARRLAWVRGITFLPFMVSPVCVAFGVLLLYPQWTASLPLLVATYALLAYPFVTKDVLAAWDALPAGYGWAARVYGAHGWQVATRVTAPLVLPSLRRGMTLAAATCVGEFAATLFLSRPEWQTLTTLIYQYLGTAGQDNEHRAMVLTAVLMLLAMGVFALLDATTQQGAPRAAMD